MYSCFSYYSCYRVAGAAIGVTGSTVIRTTYSAAVGIAGGIGGAAGGGVAVGTAYWGIDVIDG